MMAHSPRATAVRRVVISTLLAGVALVFILTNRAPGWEPFIAGGVLAVASLLLSLAALQISDLISFFALCVVVLAMFWEPGRPWAALVGLVLMLLNALKNSRLERMDAELAAQAETRAGPGAG